MKPETLENLRALFPGVEEHEDAVGDLFDLSDLVDRINHHIRALAQRTGMPPHHFFVLEHLGLEGGAAPLSDILEATNLPKQSGTHVIDRLEADGLVERRRDTRDRRRLEVVLTRRGRATVKRHFEPFYRVLLRAMDDTPQRSRRAAMRALSSFEQALSAELDTSPRD